VAHVTELSPQLSSPTAWTSKPMLALVSGVTRSQARRIGPATARRSKRT
jgi:hypothetical protein